MPLTTTHPTDPTLLRRYAQHHDQSAFTILLERHLPLVHASAMRQLKNSALADEVAQAVFLVLANKAHLLHKHRALSAWLLRATRFAAIDALRRESRTRHRERLVASQRHELVEAADLWSHIEPHLDQALAQLPDSDRALIVLRFFEEKPLAAIAQNLQLSEDAAKKRSRRALARLRHLLESRGITSLTALPTLLATHTLLAPPAALSTTILSTLSSATTAKAAVLTKGLTTMLAWTKLKNALAYATSAVLILAALVMIPQALAAAPQSGSSKQPTAPTRQAAMPSESAPTSPSFKNQIRPASPFNADEYNAMNDRDRLNFVLAMLDQYQRDLHNFSYELNQERFRIYPETGKRELLKKYLAFEFRRLDQKLWIHYIETGMGKPDVVATDTTFTFNGEIENGITMATEPGRPHSGGTAHGDGKHYAVDHLFNSLLGVSDSSGVSDPPFFGTVADAIRISASKEAEVYASAITPEAPWITLSSVERSSLSDAYTRVYRIDPAKGFMITRLDFHTDWAPRELGDPPAWMEVLRDEQINGVWVPMAAKFVSGQGPPISKFQETTYEIKRFDLGKMTDDDFIIHFPPNTQVMDTVNDVNYLTLPDGRYKLLHYLDPKKGVDHMVPEEIVVSQIDADTTNLYTNKPAVTSPPPRNNTPVSRVPSAAIEPGVGKMQLLGVLITVVAAGVAILLAKEEGRVSQDTDADRFLWRTMTRRPNINAIFLMAQAIAITTIVCAQATAGQPHAPADLPTAREHLGWQNRHKQSIAAAKRFDFDVYFVGDTIVEMFGTRGKVAWIDTLGGWNPGMFGAMGDQTQNVLWRLQNGALDAGKPRAIVILTGTNNDNNTPEEIATGIEAIVHTCRQKQPQAHILLMAIFPRNATVADQHRSKNDEVNKLIAKLDDGKQAKFLNINDKLMDKDGNLSRELFPDLLHPSEKGYQVWADAIKPQLTEWLGPPRPGVTPYGGLISQKIKTTEATTHSAAPREGPTLTEQ